jgi:hypothetical protein
VLEAIAEQRAVREPRQRIVHRLVAHALLVAESRERGRKRVRHRPHETQLLFRQGSRGRDEQLVAVADRKPQPRLRIRSV